MSANANSSEEKLRPGLRVCIHGLVSSTGSPLNGKLARVMTDQSSAGAGRVVVKVVGISNKPVSVKMSNLRTGDDDVCSACGKPGAGFSCQVCREMDLPRTYYCNQTCQRAGWKAHKKVHKEAKTGLMVLVSAEMRRDAEWHLAEEKRRGLPQGYSMRKAIFQGDLDLVRGFIDCGVDPDGIVQVESRGRDPQGKPVGELECRMVSPLSLACQLGHEHIALLLINEGCDVNFVDEDGQVALMPASGTGMVETVQLLLEKGADISVVNKKQVSVIGVACYHRSDKVIDVLLSHAAAKGITLSEHDQSVLRQANKLLH